MSREPQLLIYRVSYPEDERFRHALVIAENEDAAMRLFREYAPKSVAYEVRGIGLAEPGAKPGVMGHTFV